MKPNKSKQNKTFLAFRPESVSWILEVPASPEESQGDQMLSIIEKIFTSFENIFTVTNVACHLESKDGSEQTDSLQISDSCGVSFQDLVSRVSGTSWRIAEISLSGKLKITNTMGQDLIECSKNCSRIETYLKYSMIVMETRDYTNAKLQEE